MVVPVTFSVVEAAELGGTLTMLRLGGENTTSTLSLTTDNTTHFCVFLFLTFTEESKNLKDFLRRKTLIQCPCGVNCGEVIGGKVTCGKVN